MERRAQASTEYLVILAVVIVVAVVVAGLLGGFINLGAGTSERNEKMYWKTAKIGLADWSMNSGDVDSLVVINNENFDIYIQNITVNGVSNSVNATLAPGQTNTLKSDWVSCDKSITYSYVVAFLYDNEEYNITGKTFTGDDKISGTCE